uniref:PHD finger protein 21A n=1 Tax=Magallana gigas TaxID=29159 RepID=K1QLJ5_MAGGI
MVSRSDLDEIQAQLKISIQNHQALVTSMKDEPQNAELKKKLHDLQKEIFILSEKQRGIVQKLRSDIVNRQPDQPAHGQKKSPAKSQDSTPQPAQVVPRPIQPRPIQPAPPMQPIVLRQPVQAIQPKPVNENIPPTQSPGARGTVDIAPQKPGSPPIRVPTYHRPSILQGSKSPISKSHHVTSSFVRKPSDSDGKEFTKPLEKKQVSLEEKEASGKVGWSSDAIARVNNFITSKSAKEEERRRLQRRNSDLLTEKTQLENKNKQMNDSLTSHSSRNTVRSPLTNH